MVSSSLDEKVAKSHDMAIIVTDTATGVEITRFSAVVAVTAVVCELGKTWSVDGSFPCSAVT